MDAKDEFEKKNTELSDKNENIEKLQLEHEQNESELSSLRQSLNYLNMSNQNNYDKKFTYENPKDLENNLKLEESKLETIIAKL
jgi:predicted  nucleic acid-binding Zn-ribbon protein